MSVILQEKGWGTGQYKEGMGCTLQSDRIPVMLLLYYKIFNHSEEN